ncbi:MAG: SCO family protein [Lewinellaceae bacterium]|nr:SCO family protein [Lewinellaceae bacterium]
MKDLLYSSILLAMVMATAGCSDTPERSLPILGNREVVNGDTVYPTVQAFSFVDQDSQTVNNASFDGEAYVVDFFFIHCPTICPKVKVQCKRIYDRFLDNPHVLLLSHSIDVRNDTVAALHRYAEKLEIKTAKWHLVTGSEDEIYGMGDDYFSVARKDTTLPGGFDHSGRLILVDKNRHVRSFCDGTDPKEVDRFMDDIDLLLKEQYSPKK